MPDLFDKTTDIRDDSTSQPFFDLFTTHFESPGNDREIVYLKHAARINSYFGKSLDRPDIVGSPCGPVLGETIKFSIDDGANEVRAEEVCGKRCELDDYGRKAAPVGVGFHETD